MPTLTKASKKNRPIRRSTVVRRIKPFVPPQLLPEEIALESAILAAAAKDVAALHR